MLEEVIYNVGTKRVALSHSLLMSDSARLRVIITDGTDWKGPILPLGSAVPPGLHLNPNACLVFTGLMLPPFWTLWDLICFHFCSQLSGLHGPHLQVSVCLSPTMQPHEALPT